MACLPARDDSISCAPPTTGHVSGAEQLIPARRRVCVEVPGPAERRHVYGGVAARALAERGEGCPSRVPRSISAVAQTSAMIVC